MDTHLSLPAFIDSLYVMRNKLIEQQINGLLLLRESYQTCLEIDGAIPSCPDALPDTMTYIFYDVRTTLGEYISSAPKLSWFAPATHIQITDAVTNAVDKRLWLMVFNRLNINALLSGNHKAKLRDDLKKKCMPFTPENVEVTLFELANNREHTLAESLYDTVCKADTSYASNSRKKFGVKTIFRDAVVLSSANYYQPNSFGPFRDMLKFLSYFIFGEHVKNEGKTIKRDYLSELVAAEFEGGEVTSAKGKVVYFDGGEIRFHNNRNAHLILNEKTVDYLNAFLAKSNSLPAA